jgi:G3E family GTPase
MDKIPVTVLTGYLGAGKTTLLNRIMSEPHGKKYAVIVNEFGEIGIDNDLIVGADEEIFEMNNGCICCTVRGDLIRIISGLMKRVRNFDGILIETTGLADPGPVAQTFFADPDIADRAKLDSIVTVVDAHNIKTQLGPVAAFKADKDAQPASHEAAEQIAFADIIVLNKIDLVSSEDLDKIEQIIRRINAFAKIIRTERCQVPLNQVLGLSSFDLDEILKHEPDFLKPAAEHDDHRGHGHAHDHGHPEAGGDCHDPACHDPQHHHAPTHETHDDHVHDSSISSLSLTADRPIDVAKFEEWMGGLRADKGPDLLRYKGILDVAGSDQRLAIQGVHMMMEGSNLSPWKNGSRRQSRLVFIGRNLEKDKLKQGFQDCIAA